MSAPSSREETGNMPPISAFIDDNRRKPQPDPSYILPPPTDYGAHAYSQQQQQQQQQPQQQQSSQPTYPPQPPRAFYPHAQAQHYVQADLQAWQPPPPYPPAHGPAQPSSYSTLNSEDMLHYPPTLSESRHSGMSHHHHHPQQAQQAQQQATPQQQPPPPHQQQQQQQQQHTHPAHPDYAHDRPSTGTASSHSRSTSAPPGGLVIGSGPHQQASVRPSGPAHGQSSSTGGRGGRGGKADKGTRKFVCQVENCGRSFNTSGHLARHVKIHSGEKPYNCPIPGCASRFSRHDNMLQHYRAHMRKLQWAAPPPGVIPPVPMSPGRRPPGPSTPYVSEPYMMRTQAFAQQQQQQQPPQAQPQPQQQTPYTDLSVPSETLSVEPYPRGTDLLGRRMSMPSIPQRPITPYARAAESNPQDYSPRQDARYVDQQYMDRMYTGSEYVRGRSLSLTHLNRYSPYFTPQPPEGVWAYHYDTSMRYPPVQPPQQPPQQPQQTLSQQPQQQQQMQQRYTPYNYDARRKSPTLPLLRSLAQFEEKDASTPGATTGEAPVLTAGFAYYPTAPAYSGGMVGEKKDKEEDKKEVCECG
ncbi:uncharacterized protein SPPG_07968 [Spizellomyces punctatus DAOM BR117]|uniref:C2H2-type domain-containing protein n=1 Tax=Spizellomyces punctatus (strain DAOM BR117) TaxID=645134 RepID=A0A0L0H793_SPIPD|nr:uncharacterized protein SPPG_07968 [Spizellomyces punctatus DAOM BR117]KNC96761.1 hypothetical protein SPPG_07968 [Spizellomyces punctatus DAOM BR117]|eukprot:XP_016604801.1 hypothetical protein SPPG_07968 [Spizellomyces punctatus DAOM BR117]